MRTVHTPRWTNMRAATAGPGPSHGDCPWGRWSSGFGTWDEILVRRHFQCSQIIKIKVLIVFLACPNTRCLSRLLLLGGIIASTCWLVTSHRLQTALGGTLPKLFCKEDFPKLSKRLNANGSPSIQTFAIQLSWTLAVSTLYSSVAEN